MGGEGEEGCDEVSIKNEKFKEIVKRMRQRFRECFEMLMGIRWLGR